MQTNKIKKKTDRRRLEEEVRKIVEEICKKPKHRTYILDEAKGKKGVGDIWKDLGKAWKTMNDSIKIPPQICVQCGKELLALRLYCACGLAFCSVKCSNKYHKELRRKG